MLTIALVALLLLAWCSEGARVAVGLPHAVVGVVDLGEFLIVAWVGVDLVRKHGVRWVPPLVAVYVAWVGAGLMTDAPGAAVVTALKNALLLPALALVIAARGTTEQRARVIASVLLALGALEFVVTLAQSFRTSDSDSIVGTFGPYANAVVGAVVLLLVCVGVAGYLVRAPYGGAMLITAAVLPIFSAWTLVKLVPVALPFVTLAVVVPAVGVRRTTVRRALVALTTAAVASGVVIASYAVFNRDSFDALFTRHAAANYLQNAAISGPPAAARADIGSIVVSSYANAEVSAAPAFGSPARFRIGNGAAGDYTAWLGPARGNWMSVKPRRRYAFSFVVEPATSDRQWVMAQIEWRDHAGTVVGTTSNAMAPLAASARLTVDVSGVAPSAAVSALPKIAMAGSPHAGAAVFVSALRFGVAGGRLSPRPPPAPSGRGALPAAPAPVARPVPGRLTQWRMAEHAISASVPAELFGIGLGSATVADNLGVQPQDLSPDAEAASYSDFGSLLVERGWVGVALSALFGLAIVVAAIRLARALPDGLWTTAFTVAVPAAVVVMAGYGMVADQLRNRAAALTFWLIIALGLSPHAFLGRRRASTAHAPDGSSDA